MLPLPSLSGPVETTLQTIQVGVEPLLLAEFNRQRLFLIIYFDSNGAGTLSIARTRNELQPTSHINGYAEEPIVIYGHEELWVVSDPASSAAQTVITVHQVFRT